MQNRTLTDDRKETLTCLYAAPLADSRSHEPANGEPRFQGDAPESHA
jgi:hypothetical protein